MFSNSAVPPTMYILTYLLMNLSLTLNAIPSPPKSISDIYAWISAKIETNMHRLALNVRKRLALMSHLAPSNIGFL